MLGIGHLNDKSSRLNVNEIKDVLKILYRCGLYINKNISVISKVVEGSIVYRFVVGSSVVVVEIYPSKNIARYNIIVGGLQFANYCVISDGQ